MSVALRMLIDVRPAGICILKMSGFDRCPVSSAGACQDQAIREIVMVRSIPQRRRQHGTANFANLVALSFSVTALVITAYVYLVV